jgi:hypothetical protein
MNVERQAHPRNSLQVRAPWSLTAAVREAAEREMTTSSEYTRRALIEKLRSDGIDPNNAPLRHPATSSCDTVSVQQNG